MRCHAARADTNGPSAGAQPLKIRIDKAATTEGLGWVKKGEMARTVVQAAPHLGWIRTVAGLMRDARASHHPAKAAAQTRASVY